VEILSTGRQIGGANSAAGLLGFFAVFAALLVRSWIGASYDGMLYPIALTSAAVGSALFVSTRLLARHRFQADAHRVQEA
jgi:ABC-type Fe3+-siderophore transport system permease subunit